MADNVQLNSGSGGAKLAAKEVTHGGDTSQLQAVTIMGVSGSEGAYTVADINGDATNGLDVDVTRVIPGTSATHLGKAIDAAAGATDTGVAILGVRDDVLSALTPIEGDYAPFRLDANGAAWVIPNGGTITTVTTVSAVTSITNAVAVTDNNGSLTVDNAGTFAVQVDGAALAALQLIDDAVYVDDADWTDGTSKHLLVGGLYQSTPQTVTDGDVAPFNMTSTGALHVAVQNTVTVDGSGVTQPISAASLPLPTGAGTSANQTTIIGHLDGVEGLLTTIDTDTGAIATSTASIDGKITACNTGAVTISAALPAGDNNIGNVDIASAIPAGTNLVGKVSAGLDTASIYEGATALTPKFAAIDAATSGDNTLVAAVASKKIRVLSAFLVSAGTVNVRFESGAGGTALTGQMSLVANTGFVLPFNPAGWFETAANTLLNLELSGAISVDGSLTYVEVS